MTPASTIKTEAHGNILVIDDERYPLILYLKALSDAGFAVRHCTTTDAGLSLARESWPDLILLDVMMPPGQAYMEDQHDEGIRTGLLLFDDLRSLSPTI